MGGVGVPKSRLKQFGFRVKRLYGPALLKKIGNLNRQRFERRPGLYTLLLRLPPNTKILAHSHQDDRTACVLSGDWYFGYGREFDEAALKEMPAGSFYTEPPGVEHFGQTKDQETTIEITGYGPTSTTYVDPKNDPMKK